MAAKLNKKLRNDKDLYPNSGSATYELLDSGQSSTILSFLICKLEIIIPTLQGNCEA